MAVRVSYSSFGIVRRDWQLGFGEDGKGDEWQSWCGAKWYHEVS